MGSDGLVAAGQDPGQLTIPVCEIFGDILGTRTTRLLLCRWLCGRAKQQRCEKFDSQRLFAP